MYNYIINPQTNRKVNINSKKGKQILKNYICLIGGASGKPPLPPKSNKKPKKTQVKLKPRNEAKVIKSQNKTSAQSTPLKHISNNVVTKEDVLKILAKIRTNKALNIKFIVSYLFGGRKEIERLDNLLGKNRGKNIILSRGNVDEIFKILNKVGLIHHFHTIIDTKANAITHGKKNPALKSRYPRGFKKDEFLYDQHYSDKWDMLEGYDKPINNVIYIDDNTETNDITDLPPQLLEQKPPIRICGLASEEHGILQSNNLQLFAELDRPRASADLYVWDFDCTLTKVHLTKIYGLAISRSWMRRWGPELVNWYYSSKNFDTSNLVFDFDTRKAIVSKKSMVAEQSAIVPQQSNVVEPQLKTQDQCPEVCKTYVDSFENATYMDMAFNWKVWGDKIRNLCKNCGKHKSEHI